MADRPETTCVSGCGILLAVVAAASACQASSHPVASLEAASAAAAVSQSSPYAAEPPLTREQQQDIEWLRSILLSAMPSDTGGGSEAGIRLGAAERLMDMDLPQSNAALVEALESEEAHVMLAVIKAMQRTTSEPAEGLLNAAIAALSSAPEVLRDPLALALSRYDGTALEKVAALARDTDAAIERRLGPIHALGAFRSKAAAVQLMTLLDEARGEPQEIIHAVCASLHRGTGLPYGQDAHLWRQWWEHARDQPREEWMSNIIHRLSEQLAAAEQQIQRERDRSQHTEQRLAEAYRSLFATLRTFEEQMAALPPLLEDPLASVRSFALDRVSRLLRDSVRISDELQHQVAQRIDDDVPALRIAAVNLLVQMNYDLTSEKVASRLQRESDSRVVGALLDVLVRQPSSVATEAAAPWLHDAAYAERAANAIWESLVAGHEVPLELIDPVRQSLRDALRAGRYPAHARLLALMGDEYDVADLEALLDVDDETTRRRVADGFFRRGHRQPLLDRAHDAAVYPFAVRSLTAVPMDFATFRTLALLSPPEQHRAQWSSAVELAAAQLAPGQMLQADDLLMNIAAADDNLRVAVLTRAVNLPADTVNGAERGRFVLRLTRLLLDLQQPAAAHELLVSINGELDTPAASLVRFEAAALVGDYDAAAAAVDGPQPWMDLLARLERTDPDAARALHDEIVRRFDGTLDNELISELEAVNQRLRSADGEAESPA